MSEKIDTLDFIIHTLTEHEKRLDELTEKFEEVLRELRLLTRLIQVYVMKEVRSHVGGEDHASRGS